MTRKSEHPSRSDRGLDEARLRELEALFTANLDLIRRVVRHIASRRNLSSQDVEEFEAQVHLKLIDDDYAVLRRFEERSTLSTYLITVIQRAFLDYQVRRWGRWRPSSAARRHGPLAVELERLMHLEGRSFENACAVLSSCRGAPVDLGRLTRILAILPSRPATRRATGAEMLLEMPAPDGQADTGLRVSERQETARRAETLLGEAIGRLTPEERVLVRLSFVEGLSVAKIAATLGLDQRRLYRSIERCLATMREYMERRGLQPHMVQDLLGAPEIFMEVAGLKGKDMESPGSCPSHSSRPDSGGTSRRGEGS